MDGRSLPYTPALGLPALRSALARFYLDKHGVVVDPARIAITSGASAALLLVTAATTDPGDEVLLADPSYPCNRELVRSFGGTPVLVPTSAASRYQLTVDAATNAWSDRTTAVMIASPSNPTGTSIPPAELTRICDLARARGAWRIVDEIYLDLADPDASGAPRARSGGGPRRRRHRQLLQVLRYDRLASRLGGAARVAGPGRGTACDELLPLRLRPGAAGGAGGLQSRVARALRGPPPRTRCSTRDRPRGTRGDRPPVPVEPDGAFYVYIDVSGTGTDAWRFCEEALQYAQVSLTPGRDFADATAETHVRLSYAASRADLSEGIARLGAFLGARVGGGGSGARLGRLHRYPRRDSNRTKAILQVACLCRLGYGGVPDQPRDGGRAQVEAPRAGSARAQR